MDEGCRLYDLAPAEREKVLAAVGAALEAIPGVRLAFAFGSFARGEKFRDLDLAVRLEPGAAWWGPAEAGHRAGEAAARPPWDVDVVALDDATVAFREQIVSRGRLVFEREPGEARAYEVLALSMASDLRAWIGAREAERGASHA